jgi:hypothetical protein
LEETVRGECLAAARTALNILQEQLALGYDVELLVDVKTMIFHGACCENIQVTGGALW